MQRDIDESKRELARVKELLKDEPRGLSITDISKRLIMNRNSVSKYLNMLLVSGHVDMRTIGVAKVYFLSQRVPISAMLDFSSDLILILDGRVRMLQANDNFLDFFGLNHDDIAGESLPSPYLPEISTGGVVSVLKEVLRGTQMTRDVALEKKGSLHYFSVKFLPTVFDDGKPGATVVMEDVTDVRNAEMDLKAALRDRDLLLNEIHMRVRNNLQLISSIINLQATEISDKKARTLVRETQQRIESLALVHQTLQDSPDHAHIRVQEYLESAVSEISAFLEVDGGRIRVIVHSDEAIMGLDSGIAFGLVVNELLSNALIHAFPEGRRGTVSIRVQRAEDNEISLVVRDDGIGLPAGFDLASTDSLGLTLVRALVEEQLRGTISLDSNGGTEFYVNFRAEE